VQRSFFSRRNLAAEAESLPAFEGFVVGADVDTGSSQHLRRRHVETQEQMFEACPKPALTRVANRLRVPYLATKCQPWKW